MPEPTSHSEKTLIADERAQLDAFVHDIRAELLARRDGLTEEQARRRLVPSKTTLLGLVKHAVFVERIWFPVAIGGATRETLGLPDTPDESFDLDEADTIASVGAAYRQTWAESDEIAAPLALDDLAQHNRRGPLTLRWVLVHLVEELAQHAGHGDILRELVLAEAQPS